MIILENHAQSKNTKHAEGVQFRCRDCGQVKPVQTNGGTGYGVRRDGGLVCYDCCAVADRARMDQTGRAVLYLSKGADGRYAVGNWPGTLNLPAHVRKGRHNIAGSRYDAWFTFGGAQWHGVNYGENTQVCHCRRLKQ
jgi:hypothetical protein